MRYRIGTFSNALPCVKTNQSHWVSASTGPRAKSRTSFWMLNWLLGVHLPYSSLVDLAEESWLVYVLDNDHMTVPCTNYF